MPYRNSYTQHQLVYQCQESRNRNVRPLKQDKAAREPNETFLERRVTTGKKTQSIFQM